VKRSRSAGTFSTRWIAKGVENFARAMGIGTGSYDNFTLEMLALGAVMSVIGTREQVAEKLANLYRGGLDGMLLVSCRTSKTRSASRRRFFPC
jgi:hypothetical protein